MAKKLKIDHRTGGGRRKQEPRKFDLGTPELIAKRLRALGPQRENWPQPDPAAAESALGVLLWQGLLHPEYTQAKRMHDAGVSFAGWWTIVHPKTFAQGTLGQFQPKGSTEEIDTLEAESNLRSASAWLSRDRAILDAVINTAVYQRINLRQMEKLRTGLCRLIEWGKDRRKYDFRQKADECANDAERMMLAVR